MQVKKTKSNKRNNKNLNFLQVKKTKSNKRNNKIMEILLRKSFLALKLFYFTPTLLKNILPKM